jgi:hypothetical protein
MAISLLRIFMQVLLYVPHQRFLSDAYLKETLFGSGHFTVMFFDPVIPHVFIIDYRQNPGKPAT